MALDSRKCRLGSRLHSHTKMWKTSDEVSSFASLSCCLLLLFPASSSLPFLIPFPSPPPFSLPLFLPSFPPRDNICVGLHIVHLSCLLFLFFPFSATTPIECNIKIGQPSLQPREFTPILRLCKFKKNWGTNTLGVRLLAPTAVQLECASIPGGYDLNATII